MTGAATQAGQKRPARILLVDDHPIVRRGLTALIEGEEDLVVCGEASTCGEALRAMETMAPDLVVVDLNLGESNGLDLLREVTVRYPAVPALVLSMHDEASHGERSLRAGALGYVSKQQMESTMLVAIRQLLKGHVYMSESLATRLATKFVLEGRQNADSPLAALSDREIQVFRLLGQGRTTRQIAAVLDRSVKTIESHRENIKQKLQLETAAALVRSATDWVELDRS